MPAPYLLHQLLEYAAARTPDAEALRYRGHALTYGELVALQERVTFGLKSANVERSARVAICLSKSFEWVAAAMGAARAGCCIVPINMALKPGQVAHILNDCEVRVLVTSRERLLVLGEILAQCPQLRHVVVVGDKKTPHEATASYAVHGWTEFVAGAGGNEARLTDNDMAAIFYTSGSTGKPKGVVVSHRNVVSGAVSVVKYLDNCASDRLMALLPLSFDAGFSQLTTAFCAGATVVLLDYTVPGDALKTLAQERITGLTAVPPLWIQLSEVEWPRTIDEHLRYFANTGGTMPREVLTRLRERVPTAKPVLMYGLTEAFRSTYLSPDQVDIRVGSIGRAIPNQEILVLRQDGSVCAPGEPGELVHRGSTVSLGYWNDPERTAERFRLLPRRERGLVIPEMAVFSGDMVRKDEDGYLYFIGRNDEMIKVSGYRISPSEVEEAIYSTGLVVETVVVGVPHPRLGQAVAIAVVPRSHSTFSPEALVRELRTTLPEYMVPRYVDVRAESLPRGVNGKIDRKRVLQELKLVAP